MANAATGRARALLIEDDSRVARATAALLESLEIECVVASSGQAARVAFASSNFDVIVTDYNLGGETGTAVIRGLRQNGEPIPPVILATGSTPNLSKEDRALFVDFLEKPFTSQRLETAIERALAHRTAPSAPVSTPLDSPSGAYRLLVKTVQSLALARSQSDVVEAVRTVVRALVHCDGATFVLRDGDRSYYIDEDAIGPLFKGERFPMNACIGGYCMTKAAPVVVTDIRNDPRVPAAAYEQTFVRSLLMVPIRSVEPIGAIGAYWAARHKATSLEIDVLQGLADSASVALANVALLNDMEQRVVARTRELVRANDELARTNDELRMFTAAAAHDLRGPLTAILASSSVLQAKLPGISETHRGLLNDMHEVAESMASTLKDLLRLSKIAAEEIHRAPTNLSELAAPIVAQLRASDPKRRVEVVLQPKLEANADPPLVSILLQNLLANAWKYTSRREASHIEVGVEQTPRGRSFFVRDDGVGFEPARANELFEPFHRLHADEDFEGTGIGLVTVARVVAKHGGEVWAESVPGAQTTFWFTLEATPTGSPPAAS